MSDIDVSQDQISELKGLKKEPVQSASSDDIEALKRGTGPQTFVKPSSDIIQTFKAPSPPKAPDPRIQEVWDQSGMGERIVTAKILADQLDMEEKDTFALNDILINQIPGTDGDTKKAYKGFMGGHKYAMAMRELNNLSFQEALGLLQRPEVYEIQIQQELTKEIPDQARVEKLQQKQQNAQEAFSRIGQLQNTMSSLTPEDARWFMPKIGWTTGQMSTQMLQGMQEGFYMSLGTMAAGALAGAAGGPETALAGAVGGFTWGMGAGIYTFASRQMAGATWRKMIDQGTPAGYARAISFGSGAIQGAIELISNITMIKALPGVDKALARAAEQSIRTAVSNGTFKAIVKNATRTVLRVGAIESWEEVTQNTIDALADYMAVELTNRYARPQEEAALAEQLARQGKSAEEIQQALGAWREENLLSHQDWKQHIKEQASTVLNVFPTAALMAGPGATFDVAVETAEMRKARKAEKAVVEPMETEKAINRARRVLTQPEEITPEQIKEATARLETVFEKAKAPEEIVKVAETADSIEHELEILPGVKAKTAEEEAAVLKVITRGIKETDQVELREDVLSAQEAGIETADEFAREMKSTELPGEEKPAEVYRKQWDQSSRATAEEEAQRFINGLSREAVENQVLDAVHNIAVPPAALKLFAPIYQQISKEGGLTEEAYGTLLKKMSQNPRKWKDAFDNALTDETAEYELSRRYEAGLNARLPKQAGAGLEKYRPMKISEIVKRKKNRELEPVRKRIAKILRTVYKPPSGAIQYEEAIKIQELQDSVDNRPGSHTVKAQSRLRAYYEAHPEETPPDTLKRFMDKKFVGQMTYGELEAFNKEVQDLRNVGYIKRTMALLEEKKVIAEAQEKIKTEILGEPFEKMKDIGSVLAEKKLKGSLKKRVEAYTLNMLRLAKMLGPTSEKWLNEEVNTTLDKELRAVDKIVEPAKKKMKQLGITPKELAKQLTTEDGVRYTVDQVIHMDLAIKNDDERATLIHGNGVTVEDIRYLIDQLTPQQKEWGDYMLKVFADDNFDRMNRAYIEDTNRSSRKAQNYFPIRAREHTYEAISQEVRNDLLTRAGAKRGYAPKGFMKERMNIADEHRRPMRLGATAIFFEQIEKQEHYISHWKLAKRLQSIFTRDKNLIETIASRYGRDWNKTIATYINEISNPGAFRAAEMRHRWLDTLRQNYVVGALAGNLNSLLNNLTGPMMYLADCGPIHMMSALAQWVAQPKKIYEFVTSRDPQVKHASIDPVIEQIRHRYPNEFASFLQVTSKIGMKPLEWIDMWTRLVGWKAVYDKAKAAKLSEEQAIKAAQESTLRTQPSGRAKDMPRMYQGQGAQMFLMFTRQLNQIWNMYTADIPMDIRRGKVVHALADATALALTGIAIGTIGRKRLPKNAFEWALDIFGQFITSIPFVGNDILTGLAGYWWSGRGVNLIPGVAKAALQVGKGIKKGNDLEDWANAFLMVAPELLKLAGGPGVAAQRVIQLIKTGDPWELVGGGPKR